MATADEIRVWAREQGMNVPDKGRLSGTVRAAYEAATGELGEVEDLAPEPAGRPEGTAAATPSPRPVSPFVPSDVKDPKPARTRQKAKPGTGHKPTPAEISDIQGKTAFMLSMPAMAWAARDPFCGGIAVQVVPETSAALAAIFAGSPEVVAWFTGKGGDFMKWVALGKAVWPVAEAVIGHHITHTAGPQPDASARFAVPEDQYAA